MEIEGVRQMAEERYLVIYDEGDWILDTQEDAYLDLEVVCTLLNDYEDERNKVKSFVQFHGGIKLDEVEDDDGG